MSKVSRHRPFPAISAATAGWSERHIERRAAIAKLTAQRATMLAYLRLRLDLDDMHGVMDAASDIREIDARLSVLRSYR